MKIAITGGIGSGKSAVAEVARRKGYCVASCDETYAKLCRSEDFLKDLRKLFPDAVKEDPPRLDRKILANTVFSSDEKRAALNAFAHPRIFRAMEEETRGEKIAFYEVPLLFESGTEGLFDEVIVVIREKKERINSVMERNRLTREQVLARMRSQIDYESRNFDGCHVLINDGNLAALEEKAGKLIDALAGGSRE